MTEQCLDSAWNGRDLLRCARAEDHDGLHSVKTTILVTNADGEVVGAAWFEARWHDDPVFGASSSGEVLGLKAQLDPAKDA